MKATDWAKLGYEGLIPIIPPGSKMSPKSSLPAAAAGKAPGWKTDSGWTGTDWLHKNFKPEAIDRIEAGVGIRTEQYPAIDLDIPFPELIGPIDQALREYFGKLPPARTGAPPKKAYVFQLRGLPFGRIQRHWQWEGKRCLAEILAAGQQLVLSGTHRSGVPYTWDRPPLPAAELDWLDRDRAEGAMQVVVDVAELAGADVTGYSVSAGPGEIHTDQESLRGDIGRIREAVANIPNTPESHPDRQQYIDLGIAIKAAAGDEHEGEGYEIFEQWALLWPGADAGTIMDDWARMHTPFRLGMDYILNQARKFGYNDAPDDFGVVAPAPPAPTKAAETPAVKHSDIWMASELVRRFKGDLRYDETSAKWYRVDDGIWVPDYSGAAALAIEVCCDEAAKVARMGATDKEKKEAETKAKALCSRRMTSDMLTLAAAHRDVAVSPTEFDAHPDLLAVPGGVIDLRTGKMSSPDPSLLLSRQTAVAPADNGAAPVWEAFLAEVTGGDEEYAQYLERAVGYTLTGHTREQKFFYLYGGGGTGKTTFLDVVCAIMGDLSHVARTTLFLDSNQQHHPQEIAAMVSRRQVIVAEIKRGRKWDEARLKSLTGGDEQVARHMYGSDFNFRLQAKFWMAANTRPTFSQIDDGVSRRVRILPFPHKPKAIDMGLSDKLRVEYPAILRRFIDAARDWYENGLQEPEVVSNDTAEYIDAEDTIGQWLAECTEPAESPTTSTRVSDLFESWVCWNKRFGVDMTHESAKAFSGKLADKLKGMPRTHAAHGSVFAGLRLASGPKEFGVVQ